LANLSKTLRINFYQNRSSIVKVMTKKLGGFCAHSVIIVYVFCLLMCLKASVRRSWECEAWCSTAGQSSRRRTLPGQL